MKKILALLFMIALSLTLFACTSSTCTEHVDADGDLKCDNCAAALPCTNHVDSDLTDELSVCDLCGAPIAVGVVAYALAAVKIKVVTREDCLLLPKGEKIARLLKL